MQAKELATQLRVGNHILYMGRPMRCRAETIHAISKCHGDTFMYQPMLIEENHLRQLSFHEKIEDTPVPLGKRILFVRNTISQYFEVIVYRERDFFTVKIKQLAGSDAGITHFKCLFIHELENLYSIITKEELLKSQNAVLK